MTATVETITEQLDMAGVLPPQEQPPSATALAVTLTDTDVATATANVRHTHHHIHYQYTYIKSGSYHANKTVITF